MNRKTGLFLIAVVTAAMVTGVRYDYLFSPDEPREAEIARETLLDGRWITPHLCGLPFLEKPPLYYDTVALAYAISGMITPTVARSVSVLFGVLMLGAVFSFGYKWRGFRAGWLSLLFLLVMPRFWRYSHHILLDIVVGAFAAWGIFFFARAALRDPSESKRDSDARLFALCCAAGFLTKGLAALFTIILVAGAFCVFRRRWRLIRELLSPSSLLIFLIPVGAWVALYAREGGLAYLHEHFLNNIIGRFFQIHFELARMRFYHTDLGPVLPWHFYIQVLPETIGPSIIILPFAFWRAVKALIKPNPPGEKSSSLLLLLWAFLPAVVLSLSPTKERTYILPSYAAIAILNALWLDEKLRKGKNEWSGVGALAIVFPFALFSILAAGMEPRYFSTAAACALIPFAAWAVRLALKKRFTESVWAGFAILICILIISFSPPVLYRRYSDRCFMEFSREVWECVGGNPLYIYRPKDQLRGSLPFYGNRPVTEIWRTEELRRVLSGGSRVYVIVPNAYIEEIYCDPAFRGILHFNRKPYFPSEPHIVLVTNMEP